MQFKLFTLMYFVLAVAVGCMGWKLGAWMIRQDEWVLPFVYSLLTLGVLLIVRLLFVGGRRVVICSSIAFVATILLLLAILGPPSAPPPKAVLIVTSFSTPVAAFVGSLVFALDATKPSLLRHTIFLPACFLVAWFASVLSNGM